MKLFVTGATGLTGRHVVAALREEAPDAEVVAHVRPDSSRLDHWQTHFDALGASVDVTPWLPAAMNETLHTRKPTHVFALLGTTKKRGREAKTSGSEETYETIDYGLSKIALDAAVRAGSNPRFLYLSSMGVGPGASGAYLKVRHRLETEVRASGLPWVIARPSFIIGERDQDRPMEHVGSVLGDGALALVGVFGGKKIREKYRSQTGAELGRALARLALDANATECLAESDELRARAKS
mgnify:CR=1 FL=1